MLKNSPFTAIALLVLALLYIEYLEGGHMHLGFYAWFGFASCLAFVVVAVVLGKLIKRKDNYYDD